MKLINCFSAIMVASATFAVGPYYLEDSSSARNSGWGNAYYWVNAEGVRSGIEGGVLDSAADYVVSKSTGLYTPSGNGSDCVFGGESLKLIDGGRLFVYTQFPSRLVFPGKGLILASSEGSKFQAADGALYMVVGNVAVEGEDGVFISEKSGQTFVLEGALMGEGRLRFTKNAATVKLTGDISGFGGTVALWAANSRLEVNKNTSSCGLHFNEVGTLALSDKVTVGMLAMPAGSVLEIGGRGVRTDGVLTGWTSGHLTIKDTLTVDGSIKVVVREDALVPVFPGDASKTMSIALVTVPKATDLDAFSFSYSKAFPNAELSIVVDEVAGSKTVFLNYGPTVTLTVSDSLSQNFGLDYGSSLTNATHWSDGLVPHSGAHYLIRSAEVVSPGAALTEEHTVFLRTPGGDRKGAYCAMEFLGDTLTIGKGCCLTVMETTLLFRDRKLCLLDGSAIRNGQGISPHINGTVEMPSGEVTIGTWGKCFLFFDQPLTGGAKMCIQGAISSTSSPGGTTVFNGDMSSFSGTFEIDQLKKADYGFLGVQINAGKYSSSKLTTFDPSSILLKTQAKLVVSEDVFLAKDSNRGFAIGDDSHVTVDVSEGKSFVIGTRVTMANNGLLVKTGTGTLSLGGDMRFGEDGSENPVPGKTYTVSIKAGVLAVLGADACDGLTLQFATDASLVIGYDPNNVAFARFGIRNVKSATPFVLPEGKTVLPLAIALPTELAKTEHRMALLTVASEVAEYVRPMLLDVGVRRAGFATISWETVNDDGSVTFGRTLKPLGMVVVVR